MDRCLSTVAIRYEHDVVLARQRARQIAAAIGFDSHDQVRIATAVSEIVRNVFRYAQGGKAEFGISRTAPPALQISISDQGPGIGNLEEILNGQYVSETGMGMGILGARRLMDHFQINSAKGAGTSVSLGKTLSGQVPALSESAIAEIASQIARETPHNPFEELQRQNQELLGTLDELQKRQAELAQLNKELEDTNRGVVALYAELDERADFLRRAAELKTQFLSNMTHEFRTPVNSIISLSRLLLDHVDGKLNSEQRRQVAFIEKAANGLSELVNDLLDLAKVEAGKVKIRPAEFSVRDLLGALRGMLRPLLAHNSAVNLIFEHSSELPALNTDESKVSQILRNLISNALKYTERGEVRVSAANDDFGWIRFKVSDTGIGIAMADQNRIFEEFTQVEGPHQKGKSGTGLGLPLSRKLAELLGGNLTLSSEPGKGSVFTLRLPVQYQSEPELAFAPELPSTDLDPDRRPVLIVEDNSETLFIYDKCLKGTAYQPIPARTLKQARAALDRFHPAAIVLDIMLGSESTWPLLAELKQDPSTRPIPILVISMLENEARVRALGADAFHTKPIDRKWLVNKLARLVSRPGPRDISVERMASQRSTGSASFRQARVKSQPG